jgi:hypothetical protein
VHVPYNLQVRLPFLPHAFEACTCRPRSSVPGRLDVTAPGVAARLTVASGRLELAAPVTLAVAKRADVRIAIAINETPMPVDNTALPHQRGIQCLANAAPRTPVDSAIP